MYWKAKCRLTLVLIFILPNLILHAQQKTYDKKLVAAMKDEGLAKVQANAKKVQEMVDMVFSFGELGFQEIETSKYLTKVLSDNGFTMENGSSGIPTAWFA